MQLLARRGWMVQPAEDRRLGELRTRQLTLPLDEACFFANSFAVVVNSVCKTEGICAIVFMGRGPSCLP
jgi:thymidine kinase